MTTLTLIWFRFIQNQDRIIMLLIVVTVLMFILTGCGDDARACGEPTHPRAKPGSC